MQFMLLDTDYWTTRRWWTWLDSIGVGTPVEVTQFDGTVGFGIVLRVRKPYYCELYTVELSDRCVEVESGRLWPAILINQEICT